MRASYVNESNHLRERAAEMRVSSKELKDNNTAAVIMRLADLYDRLADRARDPKRSRSPPRFPTMQLDCNAQIEWLGQRNGCHCMPRRSALSATSHKKNSTEDPSNRVA